MPSQFGLGATLSFCWCRLGLPQMPRDSVQSSSRKEKWTSLQGVLILRKPRRLQRHVTFQALPRILEKSIELGQLEALLPTSSILNFGPEICRYNIAHLPVPARRAAPPERPYRARTASRACRSAVKGAPRRVAHQRAKKRLKAHALHIDMVALKKVPEVAAEVVHPERDTAANLLVNAPKQPKCGLRRACAQAADNCCLSNVLCVCNCI